MSELIVQCSDGHFGCHAVVSGADGLWATSKDSDEDAVQQLIIKVLARGPLEQILREGGSVQVTARPKAERSWQIKVAVSKPGEFAISGEPVVIRIKKMAPRRRRK